MRMSENNMMTARVGLVPRPAGYIQHAPHPVLLQQRHHPAFVLLRPALRVSDVQLPHLRCFPVGVLVRKTLSGYTEGPGPKHTVYRHAAACTLSLFKQHQKNE